MFEINMNLCSNSIVSIFHSDEYSYHIIKSLSKTKLISILITDTYFVGKANHGQNKRRIHFF